MNKKIALWVTLLLMMTTIACRLFVHIPNVTPVAALALFVSAYFGLRYSLPAVLGTMLVSDALIGFYNPKVMAAVYISFILSALFGLIAKKYTSVIGIGLITLSSSLIFFVITNWAVWQFDTMYAHTFVGLMQSYTMALPFLMRTVFGDLLYAGMFFGAFEYAKNWLPAMKMKQA